MVQLVKYFNENYGQQYGNIDYPRTSKEMYQTYQVIKSYGIKDDKLLELLNAIVLPKPKTNKEREMYSECLYEVSKETLPNADYNQNDETQSDYIKNRPFYSIFKKIVTIDKQNITLDDIGYGDVIINDFEYNYEYSEQPCKFIIDNIEYEGKISNDSYFGLCHSFKINENEEFYINGNGSVSSSSNFAGNHTIEAIMIEEQIIPIENKYLQKNLEINNSISLGTRSGNIGDGSSTFGFYNEASGLSSFASGNGSIASNNCSHAEGSYAKAKGLFSHAEGDHTEATGKSSHAEGSYTVAKGESSHAEGDHTEASYYAHV